jgi:amidase
MKENRLDAMLFPSTAGVSIAAKAGYPSVAVPGGYCQDGMPFGITFSAEAFSEGKLIKFAYAYEQATKKRVAPKF